MTTTASRARPIGGFTLLEVLAAVAVLAIVYTSLAQAAMQGLANQGDASRRLRASVLADQALSEIEAMLVAGTAPPLGERDLPSPDEDFAIAVEVRAFETLATALAATAHDDAAAAPAPKAAPQAGEPTDGAPKAANELLVAAPGAPPPLLEIAVRVHWVEGSIEQEVSRTTFAADPAITDAALASLAKSDAEGSQNGGQNGNDATQDGTQDGSSSGQPGGGLPPQDESGEDAP